MRNELLLATLAALVAPLARPLAQSKGQVAAVQKISKTSGGLSDSTLGAEDQFGRAVAFIEDFDLNTGAKEPVLVVGSHADDAPGLQDVGSLRLCFLAANGTVASTVRIPGNGQISELAASDHFGKAIAVLGDINDDGYVDLAVGAPRHSSNAGAVFILLMDEDGEIDSYSMIEGADLGLTGGDAPVAGDEIGRALACPGDLDDDGIADLLVSSPYRDGGGDNRGRVYAVLLDESGEVKTTPATFFGDGEGGFPTALLANNDVLGFSLATLGDVDGDGMVDIVASTHGDNNRPGSVFVVFLDDPTSSQFVKGQVRIGHRNGGSVGGFPDGLLEAQDQFGNSVAGIGDHDGDGVPDMVVGAHADDDGDDDPPCGVGGGVDCDEETPKSCNLGAVYVIYLNGPGGSAGTVKDVQKISETEGNLAGDPLECFDQFGSSVASIADYDGDCVGDIAVGARFDDDGVNIMNTGAVYLLYLQGLEASAVVVGGPTAPPTNPCFSQITPPIIGQNWLTEVSTYGGGPKRLVVISFDTCSPTLPQNLNNTWLFVGDAPYFATDLVDSGEVNSIAIPSDCSLVGTTVCAQGFHGQIGDWSGCNGLQITLGTQ